MFDQKRAIAPGTYTLLISATNPAAAPTRNFWEVSLLTAPSHSGWTPGSQAARYEHGLRAGQVILTTATAMGFSLGGRMAFFGGYPTPLASQVFEVISGAAPRSRVYLEAALLAFLALALRR
eukprot:SRR837773.9790.p2 GENE.SRR837773.9790~~SRR837773.9790.p2  ORF type:complete len:122 (-),score=28.42 SRR837773.9790:116-481(-)